MTTVLVNEGRYSVSPEGDTLIPVHPSLRDLQAKLLKNQPVTIVGTWDFSSVVEEIFISVTPVTEMITSFCIWITLPKMESILVL